jgi:hypothetical protein
MLSQPLGSAVKRSPNFQADYSCSHLCPDSPRAGTSKVLRITSKLGGAFAYLKH